MVRYRNPQLLWRNTGPRWNQDVDQKAVSAGLFPALATERPGRHPPGPTKLRTAPLSLPGARLSQPSFRRFHLRQRTTARTTPGPLSPSLSLSASLSLSLAHLCAIGPLSGSSESSYAHARFHAMTRSALRATRRERASKPARQRDSEKESRWRYPLSVNRYARRFQAWVLLAAATTVRQQPQHCPRPRSIH